jgi:hypothetical protein
VKEITIKKVEQYELHLTCQECGQTDSFILGHGLTPEEAAHRATESWGGWHVGDGEWCPLCRDKMPVDKRIDDLF